MNSSQIGSDFQPYIGLRPFTEQEQDRFFGRFEEISILLDKIQANRLTLLLAASGVGKSSLLQAGIMPELRTDSNIELIYYNTWSAPTQAFKQAISEHYAEPYKESVSLKSILRSCTLFSSKQLVLLLDQFEEFFNYHRFKGDFQPFIEELSAAILDRSLPVSFVFSMREDFALELNSLKKTLPGVFDNYFRLEKLTQEQARLAIEEPLQGTGYSFSPPAAGQEGLLEQVLDDLAKREQERHFGVQEMIDLKELPLLVEPPHLQIVCQELWERHRDDGKKQLTSAAYAKAGKTAGILNSYFLGKIGLFTKKEQVLASAAFDHLVGTRAVKIAHPLGRLAELARADGKELQLVLDRLQDYAILRRQKRGEEFWYELYHDIFSESIDNWNREFKARQRVKRLVCGAVAALFAGCVLFAGNNWRANYYGRYLASQEGIYDRIEVHQGTLAGWDIFHQRQFCYESPFLRQDLEADKRVDRSIVENRANTWARLVGRLPILDRLPRYAENGLYGKVDDLTQVLLKTNEHDLVNSLPLQLASIRTTKSIELLSDERQYKAKVLSGFVRLGQKASLHNFFTDTSMPVWLRLDAAEALSRLGDSSVVLEVVKLLVDEDTDIRVEAAGVLGKLGNNLAVPRLRKLLIDTDADVRKAAAFALGRLGDNSALPELRKLLDEGELVRTLAAQALGTLGDNSVVPELRKLLLDKDLLMRETAIKALGRLGDSSITPEVVKLLAHKYAFVRQNAAEILGRMDDSSALPELRKLLTDEAANVRWAAAEALGELDDSSFLPELRKLLMDESAFVQRDSAVLLGKLGDSSTLPELLKLLTDKSDLIQVHEKERQDVDVRRDAAGALGRLGDSSAVPELVKLLADVDVRRNAAEALGRLKAKAVAPILRRYLKNTTLRDAAATALIRMNISTPELRAWQEEQFKKAQKKLFLSSGWAKQETAAMFGSVFTEESVTLLSSLLKDDNQNVVKAAIESLGRIGEYHPALMQAQKEQLLKLTAQNTFNLRRAAIAALGQLISFQGKEPPADLLELEKQVHPALLQLLFDQEQHFVIRLAALDALGATDRQDCAAEIYDFLIKLDKNKDESLRYRSLLWLGRMAYTPAAKYIEEELKKLEGEKAAWRKQRDSEKYEATSDDDLATDQEDKTWKKEHWEYMLGNALARIKPETTGIELLNHPLYQVRQGAIRALASRIADGTDGAALVGKIIQSHQNFDPEDLPSPFPYAAFQAIDLALWNLEYSGKKDDVSKLQEILKNIQPCQIPGQEGAIKERLEWTIKRLAENLAKNAKMSTK